MQPQTRYADSGGVSVAYQVVGDGPLDLVYVPGWVSNIEYCWEEPSLARYYRRLASFSRLILFDKRGTGLSDRVAAYPTLDERMDDVRAVLDAVGSERAAVFGHSEGGSLAVVFAAAHPERTLALVTVGIFAKRVWSEDYPWAPTPEERRRFFDAIRDGWGGVVDLATLAPSMVDDVAFGRWWATYLRLSASPAAALTLARWNTDIDIRRVLPSVRVPTLVLHRRGDLDAHIEEGRYIARQIPGARFVELPGVDHLPWVGDADALLDEVEEFLTGMRHAVEPDRVLATVLFTDIVDSTKRAVAAGDRRWRETLEAHHTLTRRELARHRGREVKTLGDGFLAVFDGPARAIRCATAIRDAVHPLGIRVRAGVHTGECEVMGDDLGGVAVHIAARVTAEAGGDEVLASGTVKDLVAGSGIAFEDRGLRTLKGLPEPWRVFAVASPAPA